MLFAALLMALSPTVAKAQLKTRGHASYYHDSLHGRRMANGKLYNRDSMTCAHLKFPLGTMLKVTNEHTGHFVLVRVTDRGPYSRHFVIDLSRRAARELGIIGSKHNIVEMVPIDNVVPFRILQIDSIEIVKFDFSIPFGDAPVMEYDSLFFRQQGQLMEDLIRKQ